MSIEYTEDLPADIEILVSKGHEAAETAQGLPCHYKAFSLILRNETQQVVGVLSAYTAWSEVYVDDIWVDENQRGRGYGRQLLEALEKRFDGKGFNNINLVTSAFQAVDFYKKCGFELEFTRVNKTNSKLTKSFFVKFF